jgi:hypothetical protein
MLTRLILPAVAVVMLAGSGAMAAEMTAAQRCTALEGQFDRAIVQHGSAAKAGDAKMLRTDGGKLCTQGRYADGITKLQTALVDIGVTPSAN